jgi:hypothetical protein
VIVVEDIQQWSDPAGFKLLQSIASMKDVNSLILIFPYRDNEVLAEKDHPVESMLAEIRKNISPTSCNTNLHLLRNYLPTCRIEDMNFFFTGRHITSPDSWQSILLATILEVAGKKSADTTV